MIELDSKSKRVFLIVITICVASSLVFGFGAGFLASQIYLQELLPNEQKEESLSILKSRQNIIPAVTNKAEHEQKIIDIVKKSENAVVSVVATKDLPVLERYYINPFGDFDQGFGWGLPFNFRIPQYREGEVEPREINSGSGFIVRENGYIITNRHVVSDEDARYTVIMNDGNKYPARVIAKDPYADFAVLKIEKNNLSYLRLGDSRELNLGQTVIAIGNALGEFKNTVSVGVISGLYRNITATDGRGQSQTLTDVIQTDAAINRGNSGGPLLNLNGEVIGINTAMVMGAQNIGFAIPSGKINNALESAIRTGRIIIPFLGIRYIDITPTIKNEKNLIVDYGILIISENPEEQAIIPNSPAARAGIREGDVILEINGVKIDSQNPLTTLIRYHRVGERVSLKILRGERTLNVNVVLVERTE